MGNRLYPRLTAPSAILRYNSIVSHSVEDLMTIASTRDDRMQYAATGGARVGESELLDLRMKCLDIVSKLGFPGPATISTAREFDNLIARELYEHMDINPGEAGRNSVWSFMCLTLMPDIAKWRFNSGEAVPLARFKGGQRNTLQRLWWRAHVLKDDQLDNPFHNLATLQEDAMVAIMERPSLSSSVILARTIANAIRLIDSDTFSGSRQRIWRDAIKLILQRQVVINMEAFEPSDLRQYVIDVFNETIALINEERSLARRTG